uniref:Uncharacterized protein n=1 Tax=Arundo donax TaxID=35708 RepID=A0A0A9GJE6_ARUDO
MGNPNLHEARNLFRPARTGRPPSSAGEGAGGEGSVGSPSVPELGLESPPNRLSTVERKAVLRGRR